MARSKKWNAPRPSALARYRAMSAFFSSSSLSDPSLGDTATPTLPPIIT
jgi:hypothetical protein